MHTEYFIVVNNRQEGPLTKEELRFKNITSDTLVWRAGLPQWVNASELAELADVIAIDVTATEADRQEPEDTQWFAMIRGTRMGPTSIRELISAGANASTPVWHIGMADWAPASTQREFMDKLNGNTPPDFGQPGQSGGRDFSNNPQYGNAGGFQGGPQYGQRNDFSGNRQYDAHGFGGNMYGNQGGNGGFINPGRTNWLPWAIGATIVGFLFSCIGAIFGIIAIVQANKANSMYLAGYDAEGDQANNTAKTMTIIGYILAGVGLIASGFMFRNAGIYSLF